MSFKHLFDKAATLKSLANKSAQEIGETVESEGFQTQDIIKESRFIPAVDYSSASNFARYGSAEKYYRDSIDRVVKQYPYDGSFQERLQWENDSTEIDLYLYDNLYPRSTGYILLSADGWGTQASTANGYGLPNSLEYIYLKGGPHPNAGGMAPLYLQFSGSNFYDTGSSRGSNLRYDLSGSGVTVEFWLKKDAWTVNTTKEVVFDLWNGNTIGDDDYGRLRVALDSGADGGAPFLVTLKSGSDGVIDQSVGSSITIADEAWHHYALSFMSASAGITTKVFVDGDLNQETSLGSTGLQEVTGALQAYIGALVTTTAGGGASGAGKLSASMDEFRYWKTERSDRNIGRFWFTQVGGGVNDDPMPFKATTKKANIDLGVYYKFNEGITGVAATDSTLLDYSGRVTNGAWTGYSTSSRNTGSAIISSSAAIKEFQDPIIYPFHPEVITLRAGLIQSGSDHDAGNTAMMYGTLPAWITEDDVESGGHLSNITQIMSSYFDTLHLQVESLNKLKDIDYLSGSNKATVYGERLLTSQGLIAPELFIDATVLEKLADRSEDRVFDKSLTELKNLIYKNIYNNLNYIYKSKGTEKAFRNLIRSFGVDDDLIKINMYANNVEFDFTTNRKNQILAKKYVNFNTTSNSDATVFQLRDPGDTTNTTGFISSSTNLTGGYAVTLQAEVLFPEKFSRSDDWYTDTNVVSASLFGIHSTTTQPTDTPDSEAAQSDTTIPTDNATNFQVYAVRDVLDSSNVQFILTGSAGGYVPRLTSSLYLDVYNNSKWNLAVKISPTRYPWVAQVANSSDGGYAVEFEGVQVDAGIILNQFKVTGSIKGSTSGLPAFMSGSRRVFVGANKTNVTGATVHRCDAKVGSCRFWLDKLSTETLESHAFDPTNYGRTDSGMYPFPFQSSGSYGDLTAMDTLLLNWDFNQNTGSNASGEFRVADLSSGSATKAAAENGWLGNLLYYQHSGKGSDFETSTSTVTDKDYIVASKQNLPESLESSDMITVLSQQDEVEFTRDSRPQNYFLAFEKSMQQGISEEMINYFASLSELSTLVGAPVNLYRTQYKGLSFLRQQFFASVSNSEVDFEKFIEYYKWIDSALSLLLAQIAPVSLDFDPNIRTLIESHILERSKYQNKFPFLAKSEPDLSGTIGTIATPITVNSIINDAQGTGIESARAPTKRVTGMPNTSVLNSWKYDHAPLGATTPTPLSLLFDGTDEYVDIGSFGTWEALIGGAAGLAKEYSVSMWVKPDTMGDTYPHLYSFGAGDRNLFLYGTDYTAYLYAANRNNNQNYATTAGSVLSAGTWYHITVTFGGGNAGLTTIYVDGADATTSQDVSQNPTAITTRSCRLGRHNTGADRYSFAGNMCDAAVWDKELSSAEVSEIYGGGDRVKLSTSTCQSNLLSWWKLGNGLDDTYTGAGALADEVGGRDGTPTNFDSASDIEADSPAFIANYNGPAQNSKSVWWQNRAGRDLAAFSTPDNVDADREVLLNAIKASNSRTLNRPYKFSGGGSVVLGGVAQHINKRKDFVYDATTPEYVRGNIGIAPTTWPIGLKQAGTVPQNIMVALSGGVEQLIDSTDVYFPSQKNRLGFQVNASINQPNPSADGFGTFDIVGDGATLAPFSLYSSSIDDALATEMSSFTGSTIITNMHADLVSNQTDVPMQGPFTEKFVGGREHRHIELNQSSSKNPAFSGLDSREDRPEGFKLLMGYELTGAAADGTTSPWKAAPGRLNIVSPQYPNVSDGNNSTVGGWQFNLPHVPKANLARPEYAKRPVNIKNILMTTASLSQSMSGTLDHNRIGNYSKTYEVIQTAGRSQNDPFFQDQSFPFALHPETLATRGRFPLENPQHGAASFDDDGNQSTHVYFRQVDGSTVDIALMNGLIGGAGNAAVPHSISMWVYPRNDGAGTAGDDSIFFAHLGVRYWRMYNTNTVPYLYYYGGSGHNATSNAGYMPPNRWHHIALVHPGGSDFGGNNLVSLYINGVDRTSAQGAGTPVALTGVPLLGTYTNLGYDWRGSMCDVAIWDAPLSATDIAEIYNNGSRFDLESSRAASNLALWAPMGLEGWNRNNVVDEFGSSGDPIGYCTGGKNAVLAGKRAHWLDNVGDIVRTTSSIGPAGRGGFLGGRTQVLSGNLDYAIPARTGSDSNQVVLVNRFNAPGGWDVSSQGYMDPAHEEFSVYNALPFRNRHVINYGVSGSASAPPSGSTIIVNDQIDRPRGLNQRWTLHSGKFGRDAAFGEVTLAQAQVDADATNAVTALPSFQKIQRNTKTKLIITGSMLDTAGVDANQQNLATDQPLTTGSSYDNAFVQHAVPRSDRNYMWVTSSLKERYAFYGYDQEVLSNPTAVEHFGAKSMFFDGSSDSIALQGVAGTKAASIWARIVGGVSPSAGEVNPHYRPQKAFSLSVWVNPSSITHDDMLWAANGTGFSSVTRRLSVYSTNQLSLSIGNNWVRSNVGSFGDTDTWYHVVATYANDGDAPVIYINGVDESYQSALSNTSVMTTDGAYLGVTSYHGYMCDFAVWNKKLTAVEAAALYNGGNRINLMSTRQQPLLPANNLVAWWTLGADPRDTYDGIIYDQLAPPGSGSLHNGTPLSFASTAIQAVSPPYKAPLYGISRGGTTRVPELSLAIETGPSGTSGSYPFGTGSQLPEYYSPPYTVQGASGNINFAGFSYDESAIRYVDLPTHTLEPPLFISNKHSYLFSGSRAADFPFTHNSLFQAGDGGTWQSFGGVDGNTVNDKIVDTTGSANAAMSVAWWMYIPQTASAPAWNTNQYMTPWQFVKRDKTSSTRLIQMQPGGWSPDRWQITWYIDGGAGIYDGKLYSPYVLVEDEWHHCIVTYNGTSSITQAELATAGTLYGPSNLSGMRIYINGVLQSSFGTPQALSGAEVIDGPFNIGNRSSIAGATGPYNRPFNGYLDELQIYNRELNRGECEDLFARRGTQLAGFKAKDSLVSWYRFGTTPGDDLTVIHDYMGTANAYQQLSTGNVDNAATVQVTSKVPTSGNLTNWSDATRTIPGTGSYWSNTFINFHQTNLNLNGPYGHPSWKQIRTGEHPVARKLREGNRISVMDPPTMVAEYVSGAADPINMVRGKSSNTFVDFIEQPVVSRYRPVQVAFEDNTENPDKANNASLKVSYGNNLFYFSNQGLNNRLNLEVNTRDDQAYAGVQEFIDESELSVYAAYGEKIFPKEQNAYQHRVRTRTEYKIDNIWNKFRRYRNYPTTNSQGYWDSGSNQARDNNSSQWPLDSPIKYTQITNSVGFMEGTGSILALGWNLSGSILSGTTFNDVGIPKTGSSPPGFSTTNLLPAAGTQFGSLTSNYIYAGTGSGGGELQNTYNRFARIPKTASGLTILGLSGTIHPGASYIMPFPSSGRADAAANSGTLAGFHPWVAPFQAGIDPYRPYNEYAEKVRAIGKDHSIVPEFRISELMDFYLSEQGANDFLTKVDNLFSLTGSAISSSADSEFYNIYSTTDFLKLFKVIDEDLRGDRESENPDVNIKRLGITLEASAIKSFLPYKGFYPAERTVALSQYFSQSMGRLEYGPERMIMGNKNTGLLNWLGGTGSAASPDGSTTRGGTKLPIASTEELLSRIIIEPLFAPGILFNTIKSGIAVSNFVMLNTGSGFTHNTKPQFPPEATAKMASFIQDKHNAASTTFIGNTVTLADGYYEYNLNTSASIMSASISSASLPCLNIGTKDRAGVIAYTIWPECYSAAPGDPATPSIAGGSAGDYRSNSRAGYYLHKVPFEAIRRPQEFLAQRSLATIDDSDIGPGDTGWMYDTGLVSASLSNSVGLQGPLGIQGWTTAANFCSGPNARRIRWPGDMSSAKYELAIDNFLCETVNFFTPGLTSYLSREEEEFVPVKKDNYYGMRVRLYRPQEKDPYNTPIGQKGKHRTTFGMYSRATAFGAPIAVSASKGSNITMTHLTPPYYNGHSHVDIIWKAPYSDKPALQDIMSTAITEYQRAVEDNVDIGTHATSKGNSFKANNDIGSTTGSLNDDFVYNQMQISASVNIFDKVLVIPEGTNTQKVRWLIQSKFETPVLNFVDTPSIPHPTGSQGIADESHVGSTVAGGGAGGGSAIDTTSSYAPFQIRGMWHQYGAIPTGSEGIFLSVEDLPQKHSSSYYQGAIKVQSLRKVVGFGLSENKRIGRIAKSKIIREAIVVVPFTIVNNQRKFETLPRLNRFARAQYFADKANARLQAQPDRGLYKWRSFYWEAMAHRYNKQTDLLTRYILPPTFDYLKNPTQRPIFFDAFEFEHTLSQKDLQNIWQNLPPESNSKLEKEISSLQISEYFTNRLFGGGWGRDVQWMIFKVKQRSAMDYDIFTKQGLTKERPIVEPSLSTPYSFNWPYDYFSLVELIKINETVKYVSKDIEVRDLTEPAPAPLLGAPVGDDDPATTAVGTYSEGEAAQILNTIAVSEGSNN